MLQVVGVGAFVLLGIVGVLVWYFTRRAFLEVVATRNELAVKNQQLVEQISRREQAESELRQAQKMEALGQLTGGIAHDFNNMLAVIIGSVEIVQQRISKGEYRVDRFLQAANKAAERAVALTNHLLAFARRQPLLPEPIDANKMIAEMSYLLRSTLGEHIRTETVPAADLWPISADAHQLENAILNIAINARDAMPQGGKLTIETANAHLDAAYCEQNAELEPGDYVIISISDTGTGMTSEVASRVFDPFFTTKPIGKGTGLGLSQVYGFLKQSHGHVKIYSEVGSGTSVKLYLPRLTEKSKQARRRLRGPVQSRGSGELVLVVEDDSLVRDQTSEAMRELGYAVLDSANAADALAILDRMPKIRLLFTDVVMPEVDGKQLAEEALRRHPNLKVLFTTGYTTNAVVHGGRLDPGVNLITKPFTLEQLAEKVRAALDA
jgi:signal transduction histidine kinase/CheY-like chemotaxis protein